MVQILDGSGQPSPRLNYIPSFTQQNIVNSKPELQSGYRLMVISVCNPPGILNGTPNCNL